MPHVTLAFRFVRRSVFLFTLLSAVMGIHTSAVAADGSVSLELNKLEPQETGCRVYFVLRNKTESSFEELRLDLAVFDAAEILAKRLSFRLGPLPVNKTSLKLFTLSELTCDDFGLVLLNGVLSCVDQNGERDDCIDMLHVSTRNDTPFIK